MARSLARKHVDGNRQNHKGDPRMTYFPLSEYERDSRPRVDKKVTE
jgi:hypothetical protein